MDELPFEYDTSDAHYEAMASVAEADKSAGRLAFHDYAMNFYQLMETPPPRISPKLLAFLDEAQTVGEEPEAMLALEEVYSQSEIELPSGLEKLPVWWGLPLAREVDRLRGDKRDDVNLKDVFGWSSVHRQGAFLEIRFRQPLPLKNNIWSEVGNLLLDLHYALEPGPYTRSSRLEEFLL